MLAYKMAVEVQKSLESLRALKSEASLNRELRKLFTEVGERTLAELQNRGMVPTGDYGRRTLLTALHDAESRYQAILEGEQMAALVKGRNSVLNELQMAGVSLSFQELGAFPNPIIQRMRDYAFEASRRTMSRIIGDVMDNLATSYRQGLGIDEAADSLRDVFEGLRTYEAERIARTEINSFQNEGAELTIRELGIQYHQWWTAEDERVRDGETSDADHVFMHGQIVKVGDPFSNGLLYPGDRSGGRDTIGEWINCRCRIVPFLMPEGYMAPVGKTFFYEDDLIARE